MCAMTHVWRSEDKLSQVTSLLLWDPGLNFNYQVCLANILPAEPSRQIGFLLILEVVIQDNRPKFEPQMYYSTLLCSVSLTVVFLGASTTWPFSNPQFSALHSEAHNSSLTHCFYIMDL